MLLGKEVYERDTVTASVDVAVVVIDEACVLEADDVGVLAGVNVAVVVSDVDGVVASVVVVRVVVIAVVAVSIVDGVFMVAMGVVVLDV